MRCSEKISERYANPIKGAIEGISSIAMVGCSNISQLDEHAVFAMSEVDADRVKGSKSCRGFGETNSAGLSFRSMILYRSLYLLIS